MNVTLVYVCIKSPISFQADRKTSICTQLYALVRLKFYLEQKSLYEEFPTASINLSSGTQNGFSCSGFPQEEETFIKGCASSGIAVLRDFAHQLHELLMREII